MPLPEVGFKEITIDFLQARFWIVSEFASILVHSMKNCAVTPTILNIYSR